MKPQDPAETTGLSIYTLTNQIDADRKVLCYIINQNLNVEAVVVRHQALLVIHIALDDSLEAGKAFQGCDTPVGKF